MSGNFQTLDHGGGDVGKSVGFYGVELDFEQEVVPADVGM
jgi:hypothetical protein